MGWPYLCALILGHNDLAMLPHFPSMPHLNTIVLSHNKLRSLPADLPANVPALKKLSITHNQLSWNDGASPLPDFSLCSHLREVRISGNEQLGKLPESYATWGRGVGSDQRGTGLEMFEAADCGLATWQAVLPLLKSSKQDSNAEEHIHPDRRRHRGLNTLMLKGNSIAEDAQYRDKLLAAHPSLSVLDSTRLQGKPRRKQTTTAASESGERPSSAPVVAPSPEVHVERPGKVQQQSSKNASKHPKASKSGVSVDSTLEQQLAGEEVERKKMHKRGKRGKAKGARRADLDSEQQTIPQEKGDEDSAHLARIRARAGPSSAQDDVAASGRHVGKDKRDHKDQASQRSGKTAPGQAKARKQTGQTSDEAQVARIRARAGPPAKQDGFSSKVKGNQSFSTDGARISRPKEFAKSSHAQPTFKSQGKRKAWDNEDNQVSLRDGGGAAAKKLRTKDQPTPAMSTNMVHNAKAASPPQEQGKERTSVAGIVDVGRKGQTGRQNKGGSAAAAGTTTGGTVNPGNSTKQQYSSKPAWGQTAMRADVSLGQGGAWD